ncbi:MAG: hypothetical protein GWN13_29710 [Phycisphaerae bacterium]|nr:hypothetical protein [Phycisphaerae bacterium]
MKKSTFIMISYFSYFLLSLPFTDTLFGQDVFVSAFKGECSITYNPNNSRYLVGGSNDYTNFTNSPPITRNAAHSSLDGGQTWSTEIIALPPNYTNSADPSVDYDSNGNVYYCFLALNRDENEKAIEGGIFVYKSTNNGQPGSWFNPVTSNNGAIESHLGSTTLHDDKPWMIVDRTRTPNRIYVAWTHRIKGNSGNDRGQLNFAYSADGGNTFTTPKTIDDAPINFQDPLETIFAHGVSMTMDPSGDLFVVYLQDTLKSNLPQVDRSTIIAMKSSNGGVSFLTLPPVKSGLTSLAGSGSGVIRKQSFPSVAVSPTTRLCACSVGKQRQRTPWKSRYDSFYSFNRFRSDVDK